jgi:hypothetical protein
MVARGVACFPGGECTATPMVYVFAKGASGSWSNVKFSVGSGVGPADALTPRTFGMAAAAFQGKRIAISAPFQRGAFGVHAQPTAGTQTETLGGVYLFGEQNGQWSLFAQLGPSQASGSAAQLGFMGVSLAIDGSNIAASAQADPGTSTSGALVFGPACADVPQGAAVPGC